MRKRTKLAASAGAALAVAGAGGAIAATQLSPKEESQAVIDDAAKQLGVDPAKLNDALRQALENRIDRAVEDGTLTQEQADAMKERIEANDFPLFAGPLLGQPHRGGFGLRMRGFRELNAAAAFLGVTEAQLRASLESGKSLAEVAKAKGKSVDALVNAIVAAATKRLDEAVEEGRMTKAQRDEIVDGLKAWTTGLVNGVRPAFPGRDLKPGFRFRGPGFDFDEEREAPKPAA